MGQRARLADQRKINSANNCKICLRALRDHTHAHNCASELAAFERTAMGESFQFWCVAVCRRLTLTSTNINFIHVMFVSFWLNFFVSSCFISSCAMCCRWLGRVAFFHIFCHNSAPSSEYFTLQEHCNCCRKCSKRMQPASRTQSRIVKIESSLKLYWQRFEMKSIKI